jgi:hypothetical protein
MDADILNILQSNGVVVAPVHPIAFWSYVNDLQKGKDVESFPYASVYLLKEERKRRRDANKNTNSLSRLATQSCGISSRSNTEWILSSWEGHPGPASGDFITEFDNLDAVYEALYQYYFGSPILLEGWIVPLHHHPELNEALVAKAIAQAIHIHRSQFNVIKESSARQLENIPLSEVWGLGLPFFFLEFRHTINTQEVCYLRRDMQEAFIVSE